MKEKNKGRKRRMREGGGDKGEENKGQGRGDEGMKEGERTREESEGIR